MDSNQRANGGTAQAAPVGLTSGSTVVDTIGQMYFEGNIIDRRWMAAPKLRLPSGRLNLPALIVLADIIYWHRPTIVVDEHTNQITEVRKKFSEKEMYKSYEEWADSLGLTVRQLREAVAFLVAANIIKRRVGTFKMRSGVRSNNVAFITPIPDAIRSLTYGTAEPSKSETPHATTGSLQRHSVTRPALQRDISNQRFRKDSAKTSSSGTDDEDEGISLWLQTLRVGAARRAVLLRDHQDELRRRRKYLPWVPDVRDARALVTAHLDEPWDKPAALVEHEATTARAEARRAAARHATAQRAEERQATAAAESEVDQLDAQLAALPAAERAAIQAEAAQQARRFAATGAGIAPPVQVLARNILRERRKT